MMCKLSAEDKLDDWISYLHRDKTNIFCANEEEKEIKFACEQEKFVFIFSSHSLSAPDTARCSK